MTWGSSCPQCGEDKCGWIYGPICEGNAAQFIAKAEADRASLEQARADIKERDAQLAVAVGALDEIKRKVAAYDSPAFAAAVAAAIADETLSTLPAQAAQMLAIVEAVREWMKTKPGDLSADDALVRALHDFDANREAGRTDRSDG